jgi:hypothetical protein
VPHHANNWLNRILTSCFTTSTVNASFGLVQSRLSYIVHLCECCWSPLLIFRAWMERDEPSWSKGSPTVTGGSKPKMPRSYHKKSRTGCQRCRARRVKASLFSCCLESFMNCLSSCDPKLLYCAKKIGVDDDCCLSCENNLKSSRKCQCRSCWCPAWQQGCFKHPHPQN